ncbi:MAG: flotillin-like protein FloA [Planctomycetes bacterium]|nr:flotillin-like protein FloA [Planctomycetota bacterium]
MPKGQDLQLILLAAAGLFIFVFIIILLRYGYLWLRAFLSGAHVSLFQLVGMSLRKVNPVIIVDARVMCVKAGAPVEGNKLEALYLAGGDVLSVVRALIAASRANILLNFDEASSIDLAGRDVYEAVKISVIPKVIDAPAQTSGMTTLDAVAEDGIQLKVRARVTVRMNIKKLIGGATEETIVARIGEGIVAAIGKASTYKHVLSNPDLISKQVLEKGLDSNTAFEIVSIDIADIDVGENVGARLKADQAEADLRMYRAEAEKRRAMAVAKEQEMVALDRENRAKVTLAEAEIPMAMAYAFKEGKLGIFDYYNMKNIQADTDMRKSIAEPPENTKNDKHDDFGKK